MAGSAAEKGKSGGKDTLAVVTSIAQFTFHYGYVPFIIYLGFRRGPEQGMPPLTLLSLLWQ